MASGGSGKVMKGENPVGKHAQRIVLRAGTIRAHPMNSADNFEAEFKRAEKIN
jgi:hypothetical protein